MRVLIVSPLLCFPVNAGNRARLLGVIQSLLALGYEVHFAYIPMEIGDLAMMEKLLPNRVYNLGYQQPLARRFLPFRLLRKMAKLLKLDIGYYWSVDAWFDKEVIPKLRALQKKYCFDTVLVEYVFTSAAFGAFDDTVHKVIDAHDCFTDRHRLYVESGQTYNWFSTTQADEIKGLARSHVVLAIQPEEADFFKKSLKDTVSVVSVGHLVDLKTTVVPSKDSSAVIIGSAISINIEAVCYFIEQVLPIILNDLPSFCLYLVGDVAKYAPDHDVVVKLGRIPDVVDGYAKACFAINPVRSGTGLSIKSIEALAFGLPLLTTDCGARGLDAFVDVALIKVPNNDPKSMANAVIDLCRNPVKRHHLQEQGRKMLSKWNEEQLLLLKQAMTSTR